jgi:hypothetical protein
MGRRSTAQIYCKDWREGLLVMHSDHVKADLLDGIVRP